MIGLRTTSQVVIQTDIVRREELATLLSCDQLEQELHERLIQRMDEATQQAQSIVQQAQAEAAQIRSAARARFLRSGRLGYAAGQRAAVRDWNLQCLQHVTDDEQRWKKERDHWIDVVVDACATVLHEQDPTSLYQRAAQALDRAGAMEARALTVHVANGEGQHARAAFDAIVAPSKASAGRALRIEVLESEAILPGHCRCEWAGGCLETGLKLELEMLREALGRATPQAPPPADSALPPESSLAAPAPEQDCLARASMEQFSDLAQPRLMAAPASYGAATVSKGSLGAVA